MGDAYPLDPEIEHYYLKGQELDRLVAGHLLAIGTRPDDGDGTRRGA